MKDKELNTIKGGSLNGTLINSISRFISSILELGRSVGTALSRYKNKNYC